jgi:hypothetical protein
MTNFLFPHCNENPIYVFPEKKLHGLSPNFHIHASVSDFYIHRIGPCIFSCSRIGRQIPGNTVHTVYINCSQTYALEIGTEAAQFLLLGIFVSNFRYCVFAVQSNCHSHIRHDKLGFRILHQLLVCSDPGHSGPKNERFLKNQ